jgi:hypothetical protein
VVNPGTYRPWEPSSPGEVASFPWPAPVQSRRGDAAAWESIFQGKGPDLTWDAPGEMQESPGGPPAASTQGSDGPG